MEDYLVQQVECLGLISHFLSTLKAVGNHACLAGKPQIEQNGRRVLIRTANG